MAEGGTHHMCDGETELTTAFSTGNSSAKKKIRHPYRGGGYFIYKQTERLTSWWWALLKNLLEVFESFRVLKKLVKVQW